MKSLRNAIEGGNLLLDISASSIESAGKFIKEDHLAALDADELPEEETTHYSV